MLTGLDFADALASLPDGLDRDFARELLLIAEQDYVAAVTRREAEKNKTDESDDG